MDSPEEEIAAPLEPTDAPCRETTSGVFGVGVGLLAAVGCLGVLLIPLGGSEDAELRAKELFGESLLPFGLEVQSAAKLPTGDVMLQLERPWGVQDVGPDEVLLIEYKSMSGLSVLFSGGEDPKEKMKEWLKEPTFEWKAFLEHDEIRWGEWRSKFARVRHFEEGGKWTESARVDLSQTNRPLALMAMWGEKEQVNKEELIEILNRIVMLVEEED